MMTDWAKAQLKRMVAQAALNDYIWAFLDGTLIRVADYAKHARMPIDAAAKEENFNDKAAIRTQEIVKLFSHDLCVKNGPFQGMQYPSMKSVGSSIAPKILGSYERELHSVVEQICMNAYSEIIDIGCAEGYYAVGMAMRIPSSKVFAYDTNSDAICLCNEMAELNHVADRLVTGSFCDASVLCSLPLTSKALIISDCEGYERDLFTEEVASKLASHDLLIEVHDFIDIEISPLIRQRFKATHSITTIQSIDDITKAHSYEYDELKEYSLDDKKTILAEHRPHIMEWLFLTSHAR